MISLGAFALAAWVFLRAQGVETWKTTSGQRWAITLALVAIAVLPVALADTNYDKPAPHANSAPAVRALFARTGSSLAMAPPGGQPPARIARGRIVYPGPTNQLGADLDAFEERLVELLLHGAEPH